MPDLAALEALVPPEPAPVRIPPAPVKRLGPLAMIVALGSARQSGGPPMHIFRVLGRDPALFRAWLIFSGRLLTRGRLPRRDTELVILRVAARSGSGYEWRQHVRIALKTKLVEAQIAACAGDDRAPFTPRQRTLLTAVDELLDSRRFTDATWAGLKAELTDQETIEFCLLVGQYQGLATALGGLGVQVEP